MRTLLTVLATAALFAGPSGAEPRARDNTLVASSVLASREALDACGGRDLLDAIVPDGPFLEACKFHDACFRSGALDQGRCDADFLADMRAACAANWPAHKKPVEHGACQAAALTYYEAVNSRFGSMLYPGGMTDGQFGEITQRVTEGFAGTRHLEACAEVRNSANRKLRYVLTLHDVRGEWVATAPGLTSLALQPGETEALCVSTAISMLRNAANIGEVYVLILKVDDPSTLNPFGDLIDIDRMECAAASGRCVRAAP
jgi:hypothetical protein